MNTITRETWNRGDTIAILIDEITDVNGDLVTSFASWEFHASLKAANDDADASAIATLDTAAFTQDAANSKVIGYLETESLSLDLETDYYFDAQTVDANGYVTTAIERILVFKRDTTQRITDL